MLHGNKVFLHASFCALYVSGCDRCPLAAACTIRCNSIPICVCLCVHVSVFAHVCLLMAGAPWWQFPQSGAMVFLHVSVCAYMRLSVLIRVCLCLCVSGYGRCPLVAVSTIRCNGAPGWSLDQTRSACKSAVMSSSPRSGCLSRTSSTLLRLR